MVFYLNILATASGAFLRLLFVCLHKRQFVAHFFYVTLIKLITHVIIVLPSILLLVLLFNKSIKLIKSQLITKNNKTMSKQ